MTVSSASTPSQLCIDARMFKSGIGVYTRNLIRELHDAYNLSIHALVNTNQVDQLRPYSSQLSCLDDPIYSLREQYSVARAARRDHLLHVPHYNVPLIYTGTLLVTIHDLTHITSQLYKGRWSSRLYGRPMMKTAASRSEHIFTVSQFSKQEIIDVLGVDPQKITVVYNGVEEHFSPGDRQAAKDQLSVRFNLHSPYLLYVGNLKPHKNIPALFDAYSQLFRGPSPSHMLVIVGSGENEKIHLQTLAGSLSIEPLFLDNVRTDDLINLYRAADVTVQPSLAEGFGLTTLESMACGTPVICSTAGSLPEVAAEAALYFAPTDTDQLKRAIESILSSPALTQSLRERGSKRAAEFSWRKVAQRHFEIYKQYILDGTQALL